MKGIILNISGKGCQTVKTLFIKIYILVKIEDGIGMFGIHFGVDIFGNYSWRNIVGTF